MSKLALSIVIGSSVVGAVRGFKTVIGEVDAIGSAVKKLNREKLDLVANNKTLKRYERGIEAVAKKVKELRDKRGALEIKVITAKSKERIKGLKRELEQTKASIKRLNRVKLNLKEKFRDAKEEIVKTDKAIIGATNSAKLLGRAKSYLGRLQDYRAKARDKVVDTVAIGATV